ncbi:MAG: FlgD immunoglobulin-like domain containing protein [Melioribacteraceae bacterium]|nr:MAG: FlgD immunoglobulin-like domain containing protein [Melioribacteraceae bacterium]
MKLKLLLRMFLLLFFLSLVGLNAQTTPVVPFDGSNESYNSTTNTNKVVSYMEIIQSINEVFITGGNRLVEMQNSDGTWGWPLEGNNPTNTIGPIGMGLAQAYQQTGEQTFLDALQKTGDLLLTKTVFSPSDGYLADELDRIFGVSTYTDYVKANFYDKLVNGSYERDGNFYNTEDYVNYIRTYRSGGQANMAAWDIGLGLVGAAMCGASTIEWIDGVKAEIDELDGNAYYDVIGLAGALYGLAFVGEDYDPTAGEHAAASSINDLADILVSYQINYGGFAWNSDYVIPDDANEALQETAYAILALNEIDRANYLTQIEGAANFITSVQLSTGGWENYLTSGENNEITGEALWGLSISFPTGISNETTGVNYPSLQVAINEASEGDVIVVEGGTHNAISISNDGITVIGKDGAVINYSSPAIVINASNVTITGFTFNYNPSYYAIRIDGGSDIAIHNCKFLTKWGINNLTSNTIDARNNYWDDQRGPTHSSNQLGEGAVITDNVNYSPWWIDDTFTNWTGFTTPLNGLTGVSIEPTFTWPEAANTNSYALFVSTTNDFSSPSTNPNVIYYVNQGNNITKVMSELEDTFPLVNGNKYYWKVAARIDGVWKHSKAWEFNTAPEVNVSIGHPAEGSVIYTNSTMFTWSIGQAIGSMKFKPQIVKKATQPDALDWSTTTLTEITTNTYRTFSLCGGSKYYWRVVVLNSSNQVISFSDVTSFTTSGGTTVVATPSWPIGEALAYTNTPTLYWYLDQYAPGVKYEVTYVASTTGDLDGNGRLIGGITLPLTSNLYLKLPTLLPGTQYYWQVRSEYNGTFGEYSDAESFITNGSGTLLVPTPSYPTDDLEIYTVSPTFYWYLEGSSFGLTFEIQFGPQGNENTLTSQSIYKKITGLTPGETYKWRVRSFNGISYSDWSDYGTFKIAGGVTSSTPVLNFPIGEETVYTNRPTFSWYLDGSSLGITGYVVKYSTSDLTGSWGTTNLGTPDATDGQFVINNIYTTLWKVTADLSYGEQYYWAVAAKDASNNLSTFSSTESFVLAGGPGSGNVELTMPIGGETIYTDSPTFRWYFTGSTLGIVSYQLAYSDNGGLSSWVYVTTDKTFFTVNNLSAGATYSWKVRAYYGGSVYSTWSTIETFTIDNGSTIAQPIVGGPHNVTLNQANVTLSWINPIQGNEDVTYEIEFSTSGHFQNSEVFESSQKYQQVNNLSENSEYFWRVRTKSADGEYSNYSTTGKFSTDNSVTSVEEDIVPVTYSLDQNYPNPFNPATTISYSLPKATYVTVKIYNTLGQEVKTLLSQDMKAGVHSINWIGDNNYGQKISSGTYIYQIVAGEFMQAKKMVLLK